MVIALGLGPSLHAQKKVYTTYSGEMIFQGSEVDRSGNHVPTNMRWTVFFHLGSYINFDFTDYIGMYSGLAIRNVGFISNENIDFDGTEKFTKTIRRSYNLGIPLALKLGTFDKHFFIFGGAEYELLFHYKEKWWPDGNGNRNNTKVKYTEWFSDRTPTFIPSAFAGIQFPGGLNIKFKYYLQNFMNKDFRDSDGNYPYSDLNVNLFYVSVSWNFSYNSVTRMWTDDQAMR
jgi:hypothetical protein